MRKKKKSGSEMWMTRRLNNRCGSQPARDSRVPPVMPNHLQLLFLGSFCLTLFTLFALSNYLLSKLRQGGYDISDLILLGLPRSDERTHHQPMSAPAHFLDVRQSVVAQVLAILLAVGSSAFIYLKFGRSGTSLCPTYFAPSSPDSLATN